MGRVGVICCKAKGPNAAVRCARPLSLDRPIPIVSYRIYPSATEPNGDPVIINDQKMTKPGVPPGRLTGKGRGVDLDTDLFAARTQKTSIQWPTGHQIQGVSALLARMVEMGIRFEANGDYFKSGDLAYQIREIIRTTAELLKR